jgi:hypothetical protein
MKLEIDLVPKTAWYSNLRNKIPRADWDKIRKKAYADAGKKCAICGAKGILDCHEIWAYDDEKHIQELKGFIALCNNCHMIKHIGLAGIKASKGQLDMDELIEHFTKVNGVDRDAFEKHYRNAFAIWKARSEHQWQTKLSKWADLVSD